MEISKTFSIQQKIEDSLSPKATTQAPEVPFSPFSESSHFNADAWFATPELRSATQKNLLEIVVAWEGIILDIRHYDTPRRIAFGTNNHADFHFPIDTGTDDPREGTYFPLIEPVKNGFLLCFWPEMEGTIEENGETLTLLDLVNEGRAHCFDKSGRCYYPLFPGAQFHFNCKGLDIKVRYVVAPQFSLAWSRHLGLNAPILSFSIITHLLMAMLAILSTSPPTPAQKQPNQAIPAQVQKTTKKQLLKVSTYLNPIHLCIPVPSSTKKRREKSEKKRHQWFFIQKTKTKKYSSFERKCNKSQKQ